MKRINVLGGLMSVVAMLTGCGNGESKKDVDSGETLSAKDLVYKSLADMGISEGFDSDKKRTTVVYSAVYYLKKTGPYDWFDYHDDSFDYHDDSFDYKDFPDDFEVKRFKTVWRAYAGTLAEIARCNETRCNEKGTTTKTQRDRLDGVVTITSAESFDANTDTYEHAVAVCQSEKKRQLYEDYMAGRKSNPPGKYTLTEWIERNSQTGILCPRAIVDKDGVWWRVAGFSVEVEGRKADAIRMVVENAKRYAFEAAIRTISVEVAATSSCMTNNGNEKVLEAIKITPCCKVSPSDPTRVQWFDFERKSIFTDKRTRLVVCAIREDADK